MKSVIASAILMATSAQACIRVKSYMWSSGTFHDSMSVDVWDNNDFHCEMSQEKSGVSAETRWEMECNGDKYYKVVLWNNGGDGTVEHKVEGKFTWPDCWNNNYSRMKSLTCEHDRWQCLVCQSQSARFVVRVQLHRPDREWLGLHVLRDGAYLGF
jgi:hypothetical protein